MEPGDIDNSFSRQELENALRLRLQAGESEYRKAVERYEMLLKAGPGRDSSLAIAREHVRRTSNRYTDLLRTFTDLIVYFKATEETYSAAFGDDESIPARTDISIVEDDEPVRAAMTSLVRSAG